MPLSAGDKLGPYEILAPLGAGGMGEVYRARDSKLNRDVAIKILPAALSNDAQYMARFEREARMLAALNHPNIATVHGIEQGALVMELIEGADLKGPLPVDEAVAIARQIAAGLEAAHEKGIIHRDLKPANIKLTPTGLVKILDFGLAKSAGESSAASGSNPTISPTLSLAMTQAGMILGTAAYMSPEQARGKVVDKRTDIWAFGVVVHEIITGKRLFEGEDLTETLASVVKDQPDLSGVPANVRRLLERCLEKDPKKRLRDIGDMELLLADQPAPPSLSTASPSGKLPWIAVAGVMTVIAAVSLWALWRAAQPVDRPLVRLDVDLGADVSLPAPTAGGSSVVISPDGTRLAYASGTPTKLFTRRLDQPKATELLGTQGATEPFFSPEGRWVGFYSNGKMNKISVDGGAVVPLGDPAGFEGASWGEDGGIFVAAEQKGLRFPTGGGPPETVAETRNDEFSLHSPEILPGGKAVLLAVDYPGPVDKTTIEVVTLADHHRKILLRGGASPRYLATSNASNGVGHLLYVNHATLFAIPFDPDKLETRGTAMPMLEDVAAESLVGTGQFDVSRTGTLVYRRRTGGAATMMTLQWVDPAGKREPIGIKPGSYQSPRLSPDGKRVTLTIGQGETSDIWVYNSQRDAMTRLTFGGGYAYSIWSPDGQYVVFGCIGKGIFQARSDGAGQPQALIDGKLQVPWSFTPDGKRLAYFEFTENTQLWTVPLEEQGGWLKAGKPEQFLKSRSTDVSPAFSPDGRWLAYTSNDSGRDEVYVRAFPPPASGQGGKWQISNSGGTGPRWSRTGHELMYRSGDLIMAASFTVNGDTFVPEKPRVWIAKLGGTQWDLAPDGKRVVVLIAVALPGGAESAPKPEHEIVMLLNFFDELRRKVPAAKHIPRGE
jgi:serine/threonine protein kinase